MEITIVEFEEVLDRRFTKFEQHIDKKFATKEDLKSFATKEDLKSFATKDDLKGFVTEEFLKTELEKQTKELKAYTDEQTDTLAAYIAETIAIPLEDLKTDFKEHISEQGQKVTFPAR